MLSFLLKWTLDRFPTRRIIVMSLLNMMLPCVALASGKTALSEQRVWQSQWIWQTVDGPSDKWMCFRKIFNLGSAPASATAYIAVDSKYWLWVNGTMVAFEGGLKRGPTPNDSYYDEIDIGGYLKQGSNTIAVLVWFWGKEGFSHKNSGKGGLVFECNAGGMLIASDATWKIMPHPSYFTTDAPQTHWRYSEHNIGYNAGRIFGDWFLPGYDDSQWQTPILKGAPPCAPWNALWRRPIPQWKNSGLLDYVNKASLPADGAGDTIVAQLPYNAQITPYFKIEAPAGLKIEIKPEFYQVPPYPDLDWLGIRTEYLTRSGIQEFESPAWFSGHAVHYIIPTGVKILELKYRETGYNADFTGSFSCNDAFFDRLWEKSRRTLYVNMRDNFMDCPDRERAQWWGDVVIQLGQVFYCLDTTAAALIRKAISNLVEWRKNATVLHSPVPAGTKEDELPQQMLASVGWFGFWTYYLYTGDLAAIRDAYPVVKEYLNLWTLGADGLIVHRRGDWNWGDWGTGIDMAVLDNAWYYLALRAAIAMANSTGNSSDLSAFNTKKTSIETNFDRVYWKGNAYASGSTVDDRANALAVLAGLASSSRWPAIRSVLATTRQASPYMEKYVLEALFKMGYPDDALDRMKARNGEMVSSNLTTLWEVWQPDPGHSRNHAWSGGSLTLLSQYVTGVAPETPGYQTYHVLPQMGTLSSAAVVVPSVKGNIHVSLSKQTGQFDLSLVSPSNTVAIVGIPKYAFAKKIAANGNIVFENGSFLGGVAGISDAGSDGQYQKFSVVPGSWTFMAAENIGIHAGGPIAANPAWRAIVRSGGVEVSYRVREQGRVKIAAYDVQGRLCKVLLDETRSPGSYVVQWKPDPIATGVYQVVYETGGRQELGRIVLLE